MKKVETKNFLVFDEDKRLFSRLTGDPSLRGALSGYTSRFVHPSSHVQDPIGGKPTVAVLNLTSLKGQAKTLLRRYDKAARFKAILVCSDRNMGMEVVEDRRGIVTEGSEQTVVETVRLVLEGERRSQEMELERRRADRLERRNRRLKKEIDDLLSIGEIARSITSTLLIEEILKGILKGIRQVLSLDRVLLGLVNAETGEEEVKVVIGVEDLKPREAKWKISCDDQVWKQLEESRGPLILDPNSLNDLPEVLRTVSAKRMIKAPIIVKDQIIGTITGGRSSGRFTRRELKLLQILVEYAGIAIENGRLYYEVITSEEKLRGTQRQLVEAERLAVIGQLAVSINHEINNPLCNISLVTQTLKARLADQAPEILPRLEGIEHNVERIREVTERVSRVKAVQPTEYLPDQLMISLK